jgi:hypothetical protein
MVKNEANPLISKEFHPMDTHFNYSRTTNTPKSTIPGSSPMNLRILGHSLTLAEDISALEECLALERAAGGPPQYTQTTGIFSPPAVPYCEFLMLHNGFGKLLAVTRLMRLGGANPISGPLETGNFQLSPLLTALRYSREGVMEMGSPSFVPGCDYAKAARLLWRGLMHYMERKGLGFVLGSDVLLKAENDPESIPRLMDAHGLHPDLEAEAFSKFRSTKLDVPKDRFSRNDASNLDKLPPGLHEALRRGCRLAAEPVLNQMTGRWEFIWVSFREMLVNGDGGGLSQ